MLAVVIVSILVSLASGQYYCPNYGGVCMTSCNLYRTSSTISLCPTGYRCCVQTTSTINYCATRFGGTCKDLTGTCTGKRYRGTGFNICPSASQYCCVGGSGVTNAPVTNPPQTTKPGTVTQKPPVSSGKGCGTRKILGTQRVVGSSNARQGAWPWQADMLKNGGHSCGGTLINDEWVLTAAHCFRGLTSSTRLSVALGEHYLRQRDGNEQIIPVSKYIIHKSFDRYNAQNNANDIALLKLSRKAQFNDYVNFACMPSPNENFDSNKNCYVTGWGLTRSTQNREILQETKGPMVPNSQCRFRWGYKVTDKIVCHGNGQHGACKGDSGGPLVCEKNGKFTLVGVVSFGTNECNKYGFPTVYTRVAAYTDWILENTRN